MKEPICKLLFLFILLFTSCEKEKTLILPDNIIAGQKSGPGISYFDFEPDIKCFISEPWIKQDTIIQIDLDNDGINDFTFQRKMGHPGFRGGQSDGITLIPLNNNEINVIPTKNPEPVIEPCAHTSLDWVDTLSVSDTIHSTLNFWTNKSALIFQFSSIFNTCSINEGFWSKVSNINDKYIGFKIVKDGKNYYGWIGLYRDLPSNFDDLIITDYAIVQYYKE
ncbi:MAG: hypothetical protein Q8T08_06115 [Ignavibacteria bacterium]|nr:hypothetical protein [Ignavibacteria bacterium]